MDFWSTIFSDNPMISENLMKIGGNVLNNALGYYRGSVDKQDEPWSCFKVRARLNQVFVAGCGQPKMGFSPPERDVTSDYKGFNLI